MSSVLTIWLLYIAVLLSPGANTLLVTQIAASDRKRTARFAAMGVAFGSTFWCICAVCGIHVIFVLFPALRLVLQIAGGLYLLFLAFRLWRVPSLSSAETAPSSKSSLAAFRLGFLTNLTNPKAALFFGSILAASFPASPGKALQLSVVTVIMVTSASWYMLLVYLFSHSRVRARYESSRATFNRVTAVAVSSIGLSLLVATLREAKGHLFAASRV